MKQIIPIIILLTLLGLTSYAQEGIPAIKGPVHDPAVLAMIYVPINPHDTAFQKTDFQLPVKGYPYFKMDNTAPIYTRAKMDSVITYIQGLFKEESTKK